MRCHRRQEVTGLTVNERIAVPRDTLRRFRALLHRIETTGPEGKRWVRGGNVLLSAAGFAALCADGGRQGRHLTGDACRYAGQMPRRRTARPACGRHLPGQGRRRPAAVGEVVASCRTSGASAGAGPGGTSGQWHGRGPSGQFHSRNGPAILASAPPVQGSRFAAAPRQQPGATPSRPPLLPSSLWRPLLVVAALGAAWRVPLAGVMLAAAMAGAIALYRWWRPRG